MSAGEPLVPPPLPPELLRDDSLPWPHRGAPGPRPARAKERWWLHILLFLMTVATTTWAGAYFAPNLNPDMFRDQVGGLTPEQRTFLLWNGFTLFALPLMSILFAHEMGHYLMCRHYGIDASPPFFLPLPPIVSFSGTLGAFIRIREPFRNKKELFDVGVGGPIAGFVVALPVVIWGVLGTRPHTEPAELGSTVFGYPLLITVVQKLFRGWTFTSYEVYEHPMLMAGWFGLLLTAINLLPLGQLDGGHATYAVLGRRHRSVAWAMLAILFVAGFRSPGWWVLGVVFLILVGLRHAPVLDEATPLDGRRKLVALGVLAIFLLCLAPNPIDQVRTSPTRRPPREGRGTVVHQLDLHRRPEDAGRDRSAVRPQRGHEPREERLGHVGTGRALETGAPPA